MTEDYDSFVNKRLLKEIIDEGVQVGIGNNMTDIRGTCYT